MTRVTFPLPAAAAADLQRIYAEPGRVGAGLSEATLSRALDLARQVTGGAKACFLLAGRGRVGDALPVAESVLDTLEATSIRAGEGDDGHLLLAPLRAPLSASGEGPARTFGVLAVGPVAPDYAPWPELSVHVASLLVEASLAVAADTDPTTGLLTRTAFEHVLAEASERIAHSERAALLLLDVDDLRALNATRGVHAGDAFLRTLGAAVREEARGKGTACRYGGDELALLLFGVTLEDAQAVARRVALAASESDVSISVGLAASPHQAETTAELVLRADQALARAKAMGKGRAVTWEPGLRRLRRRDRLAGILSGDPTRDYRNVQALLETVDAVSRLAPLDETLARIVDRCVELTDARRGLLLLCEGDAWTARVARTRGGESLPLDSEFATSVAQAALDQGRAISRLAEADQTISTSADALGVKAILCAPLAGEDVPEGVLYVDAPAGIDRFDPATIAFFGALTAEVATALRNATLYARLLERAQRLEDDVSGREAELAKVKQLWARDCKARPDTTGAYEELLGASPAMLELFEQLTSLEGSSAPVVVEGESGTGKELVARAIHSRSPRRQGPLVAVDCGAIPAGLFESELFGHVRGAFTGAHADRAGLMEAANGGTLFLDEVAELPLEAQAKLLRALQEGEVRRVGASKASSVDVRVVAATNRDLAEMVKEGAFREDLFYRLAVFHLRTPPLRARPSDVPLLAKRVLAELEAEASDAALRVLVEAPWPGNVRQLRNVLERAATLAGGARIEPEHIQPASTSAASLGEDLFAMPFKEAKAAFATRYAQRLTEQEDGSIPAAARRAGVSRQTFYRLLGRSD